MAETPREGNLKAPIRHALDWQNPDFYNEESLHTEMERVFDICHGCRRCVSLCQSFPTLFDLIDASESMEVDGVSKDDYGKVVDHCYLCDLCYMTKCPYVPPHEWNLDFPHLMLRAKAVHYKNHGAKLRDRVLTSTDMVGRLAGIPVVAQVVNAVNKVGPARKVLEAAAEVHSEAWLPEFSSKPLRSRLHKLSLDTLGFILQLNALSCNDTRFRIIIFADDRINAVLDDLPARLAELAGNDASYLPLLRDYLREGAESIERDELVVRVNARDLPRLRKDWEKYAKEAAPGKRLTLSPETLDGTGGVLIVSSDGNIRLDNTFEGRMERLEETLQSAVAERLMPQQTGEANSG